MIAYILILAGQSLTGAPWQLVAGRAAPANRALRLTSGLMRGFAALGLLAFPFPMVANEVLGANTSHTIIWGVITPLLMLAGIGVSAAARWPRRPDR